MSKLIREKFIAIYLALFFVFRYIFGRITGYYIKDPVVTPHPIDVHPYECKVVFDSNYIIDAKHTGYDHTKYFQSFLPLDLVFPLIYTLLFLCTIEVFKNIAGYKYFFTLILAGALFDYLEDLSFALFLNLSKDGLAGAVAFFSSFKTILFIFNLLVAMLTLVYILFREIKKLAHKSAARSN